VVCAKSQLRIVQGATLLELLHFYAEKYMHMAADLHDLEVCTYMDEHSDDESEKKETQERSRDSLLDCANCCDAIGLRVSLLHANELIEAIKYGPLAAADVKSLRQNIERELSCHFFIAIPDLRKSAFIESRKGWEDIADAFPRSIDEIEEMNKCFALCRYSAAVFHSLLVVEHGLVAMGKPLGITDPKEGWDATCRKLEAIVKAGHNENKTSLDFNFLSQINACVQTMKLAWRNKVNHATGRIIVMSGGFAPDIAEEIIIATRGFMRRLAAGMKAERAKPNHAFGPPDWGESGV
jgi:hypothetical protein